MDSEPSLREHGLRMGELEPGPTGSIADVDGVAVGHVTVVRDEPDPPEGRGVARSGVTAVVPGPVERLWGEPLSAGTAVLNGAGELTSSVEIMEWGLLSTPVYLTATMSVGRVFDGAVATAIAADPGLGVDHVVIPTVGECEDSWLNDARVVQVEADDAGRAVADAASSSGVVEGVASRSTSRWSSAPTASRICARCSLDSTTSPTRSRSCPASRWAAHAAASRAQRPSRSGNG